MTYFLGVSTFGVCSSLAVYRAGGLLMIYPVSQQVSETWILLGDSYTADTFHSVMDYCGGIVSPVALREMRTKSLFVLVTCTPNPTVLYDLTSSQSGFGIINKHVP